MQAERLRPRHIWTKTAYIYIRTQIFDLSSLMASAAIHLAGGSPAPDAFGARHRGDPQRGTAFSDIPQRPVHSFLHKIPVVECIFLN